MCHPRFRTENGANPVFGGGAAALLWGPFLVARRPRWALVQPRCTLIRQRNTHQRRLVPPAN